MDLGSYHKCQIFKKFRSDDRTIKFAGPGQGKVIQVPVDVNRIVIDVARLELTTIQGPPFGQFGTSSRKITITDATNNDWVEIIMHENCRESLMFTGEMTGGTAPPSPGPGLWPSEPRFRHGCQGCIHAPVNRPGCAMFAPVEAVFML